MNGKERTDFLERCHYGNVRTPFQTQINLSCYRLIFSFMEGGRPVSMRGCRYTDLLVPSPGEIHDCHCGSLLLAVTAAIPHHCSECVLIVGRGLVLYCSEELRFFSWELFWKKNKPFLKVTLWPYLKIVSFLKNEAGLWVWPSGTLPAATVSQLWDALALLVLGPLGLHVIGVRAEFGRSLG